MLEANWEDTGSRVERATKDGGQTVGKWWGGFFLKKVVLYRTHTGITVSRKAVKNWQNR